MIKLSGIICNGCRTTIRPYSEDERNRLLDQKFHLCTKCTEEFGNDLRLDELERSKPYLNSDYYWKRVKELGKLSNEQVDIMKFNENQNT